MANKPMKRYSKSLAISRIKKKKNTTTRYHFKPSRVVIIKETLTTVGYW